MNKCLKRGLLRVVFLSGLLAASLGAMAQTSGVPWGWGWNGYGQLGNGTNSDSNVRVPVSGLTGVEAVACGHYYSLALKSDGTAWACGSGATGELGNGTNGESNIPVRVSGLSGVTAIAAGGEHGLAIEADGKVWAWGYNSYGQLGNGTTILSNVPVSVSSLTGVTAIAGGNFHSLALKNDDSVWAWGLNSSGQLGTGTSIRYSSVPVQVTAIEGIVGIDAGYEHSLAHRTDGTVWAWGNNSMGQLGNGTFASSNVPVQVSGLTDVTAIASKGDHSLSVKADGTVWAWGGGTSGQLGNGANADSNTPVQVIGLTDVTAIACGYLSSYAIQNDGTAWAWGDNYYGELGNGTNNSSNVPVQVCGLLGLRTIAGGQTYALAVGDSCLDITPPPASLPGGTVATPYEQMMTASGGTAPYTFTAGGLPTGLNLASDGLLSGIPTAAGTFNFSVAARDVTGCAGSKGYQVTMTCATINVSPTIIPNGTVGTAYSQQFTAIGGTAPYTFEASSLPAGLILTSEGLLSGTPTAALTTHFRITATDSNSCSGYQDYQVRIDCAITFLPTSLPNGTVGTVYSQTITASGGTAPYAFGWFGGAIPTGLTFHDNGRISGTPSAEGVFPFWVTVTDAKSCSVSKSYSVTIVSGSCPTIAISPAGLPGGTVGTTYSQAIAVSGGTSPYTYAVTSGSLPGGLSLSSGGMLGGTSNAAGTFGFQLTVTDVHQCSRSQDYVITMACPTFTFSPSSLPWGTVGAAYSQAIIASGGTVPYSYAITAGAPPTGLSLASGGLLSGTPTAAGTFRFTITVIDSLSCTGNQTCLVTISPATCPAIALSPSSVLPGGKVGAAYIQTITANGGTAPYVYTVAAGTLPTGLSLSSSGLLYGAPTAGGVFNFLVTATDATGCTGDQNYTVSIAVVPPPVISSLMKVGNPFRIVVHGTNLQPGAKAYINSSVSEWNSLAWKSTSKMVIKGGAALKTAVPKGTPTTVTFVNPDGGTATVTGWAW